MTDKKMICRHPDAAWRKLDGQIVVVAPENGTLHLFNGAAGFLWEQLENRKTVQELADAILAEYDADADTALKDVEEFVSEMIEKKVIETARA